MASAYSVIAKIWITELRIYILLTIDQDPDQSEVIKEPCFRQCTTIRGIACSNPQRHRQNPGKLQTENFQDFSNADPELEES